MFGQRESLDFRFFVPVSEHEIYPPARQESLIVSPGLPGFPNERHNHKSLFAAHHLPGIVFLQPAAQNQPARTRTEDGRWKSEDGGMKMQEGGQKRKEVGRPHSSPLVLLAQRPKDNLLVYPVDELGPEPRLDFGRK